MVDKIPFLWSNVVMFLEDYTPRTSYGCYLVWESINVIQMGYPKEILDLVQGNLA